MTDLFTGVSYRVMPLDGVYQGSGIIGGTISSLSNMWLVMMGYIAPRANLTNFWTPMTVFYSAK